MEFGSEHRARKKKRVGQLSIYDETKTRGTTREVALNSFTGIACVCVPEPFYWQRRGEQRESKRFGLNIFHHAFENAQDRLASNVGGACANSIVYGKEQGGGGERGGNPGVWLVDEFTFVLEMRFAQFWPQFIGLCMDNTQSPKYFQSLCCAVTGNY